MSGVGTSSHVMACEESRVDLLAPAGHQTVRCSNGKMETQSCSCGATAHNALLPLNLWNRMRDDDGSSELGRISTSEDQEPAEPPWKRPATAPGSRASTNMREAQRTIAAMVADEALQVTVLVLAGLLHVHVHEHA